MNYEAQTQRTWPLLLTWFRVRSALGQLRHIFIPVIRHSTIT
jgi:hypothetical protein